MAVMAYCTRRQMGQLASAGGRLPLEDRRATDEEVLSHRDVPGRQALDDQLGVQASDAEVADLGLVIRPEVHAALLRTLQPEGALDAGGRFLVAPEEQVVVEWQGGLVAIEDAM